MDLVLLDFGLIDGVAGNGGTVEIVLSVVTNMLPSVVRTAYCRSPVDGFMVEETICTNVSFAKTISPGRNEVGVFSLAVLGETVVMAYDRSADNVD